MTSPAWLTVLTTTDSEEKAHAFSAPVTSVYRWQNAIETTEEWQVLFKTPAERYDDLEEHLRAAHDYDTPEIIAVPVVRGSDRYLNWLTSQTAPVTGL